MKIIILFFLCLFFSCFGCNKFYFLQSVLLKKTPTPCLIKILPQIIKSIRPEEVPDTIFTDIMHGVIRTNSNMAKHSGVLLHSFKKFKDVPGYRSTIWQVLAHHADRGFVKGHMFEIEQALLLSNSGHTIKAFNQMISCGEFTREFDIITDTHLIECKNIKWHNKKDTLKKQLFHQAKLAELIKTSEQCTQYPSSFFVASRSSIPPRWKTWLNSENISFQDCLKIKLDACTHH